MVWGGIVREERVKEEPTSRRHRHGNAFCGVNRVRINDKVVCDGYVGQCATPMTTGQDYHTTVFEGRVV
jgi:hypothetical protein